MSPVVLLTGKYWIRWNLVLMVPHFWGKGKESPALAWLIPGFPLNYPGNSINYVFQDRYGVNTTRHSIIGEVAKLIPFSFTIKLPPPQYKRAIVARNKQIGQIIRSVPVRQ
jgi:hypothetical protein